MTSAHLDYELPTLPSSDGSLKITVAYCTLSNQQVSTAVSTTDETRLSASFRAVRFPSLKQPNASPLNPVGRLQSPHLLTESGGFCYRNALRIYVAEICLREMSRQGTDSRTTARVA
jgi:hypothetical protein